MDGIRYPAVDAAFIEKRGFRKYAGAWSPWALGVGTVVTPVSLFLNPEYRPGIWGCAIWFLTGTACFGRYGRHHLVKSQEEAFAIGHRSKSETVPGLAG